MSKEKNNKSVEQWRGRFVFDDKKFFEIAQPRKDAFDRDKKDDSQQDGEDGHV